MENIVSFARSDDETLRQEALRSAYESFKNRTDGAFTFPVFLKECFEREVWKLPRRFVNGQVYKPEGFHEFVTAPYPRGLGSKYEDIRRVLIDSPETLELWDKATKRGPGGQVGNVNAAKSETNVDNVHVRSDGRPTGNAAQAGLRRLTKAAKGEFDPETGEVLVEPDPRAELLLEKFRAGEISVNAACVEMGWRPKTVTVKDDPEALVDKAGGVGGKAPQILSDEEVRERRFRTLVRAWNNADAETRERFDDYRADKERSVFDATRAGGA